MKLIDWPKYSSVLSKRIDDAKRKQSIYSQISLNCYGSGGSNTGQKNSAFGHPYCLESKCNMHLSETRHSKENGWAYIVSSAVCFDRLDMSHYFLFTKRYTRRHRCQWFLGKRATHEDHVDVVGYASMLCTDGCLSQVLAVFESFSLYLHTCWQ